MSIRMTRPYIPPKPTKIARLTTQQRDDLADAIAPTTLTRRLVASIEAQLHDYRQKTLADPDNARRLAAWVERGHRADTAAAELLAVLPLVEGDDDPLVALLRDRRAAWAAFRRKMPTTAKHRPDDGFIGWACFSVVRALDKGGIPLNLGRNTPVVETLRLVRRWADERAGRTPQTRTNLYEFTRAIVEGYQRSPK